MNSRLCFILGLAVGGLAMFDAGALLLLDWPYSPNERFVLERGCRVTFDFNHGTIVMAPGSDAAVQFNTSEKGDCATTLMNLTVDGTLATEHGSVATRYATRLTRE